MRRADRLGWVSLHTALCTKGGGYGREDGDEDVEDFTPGGIVVESSHSVLDVLRLVIYQRDGTRNIGYIQINLQLFYDIYLKMKSGFLTNGV